MRQTMESPPPSRLIEARHREQAAQKQSFFARACDQFDNYKNVADLLAKEDPEPDDESGGATKFEREQRKLDAVERSIAAITVHSSGPSFDDAPSAGPDVAERQVVEIGRAHV